MLAANKMTPIKDFPEKNFGLNQSEFQSLLEQLQDGDETLINQVFLRHLKNCITFLMKNRHCAYDVAYDCAIDALMEIRKDLCNNKIVYGNLESYFLNRAGRIYYKRNQLVGIKSLVSIDNIELEKEEQTETELIKSEFKKLIKQALQKLCPECRKILRSFYYEEVPFKKIATQLELKHNTVLQKATRCRQKLRALLGETFYQQFKPFF